MIVQGETTTINPYVILVLYEYLHNLQLYIALWNKNHRDAENWNKKANYDLYEQKKKCVLYIWAEDYSLTISQQAEIHLPLKNRLYKSKKNDGMISWDTDNRC